MEGSAFSALSFLSSSSLHEETTNRGNIAEVCMQVRYLETFDQIRLVVNFLDIHGTDAFRGKLEASRSRV